MDVNFEEIYGEESIVLHSIVRILNHIVVVSNQVPICSDSHFVCFDKWFSVCKIASHFE